MRGMPLMPLMPRSTSYFSRMPPQSLALDTLQLSSGPVSIYRVSSVAKQGIGDVDRLPFSIRVLLENVLRHSGNGVVTDRHVAAVGGWKPTPDQSLELPFMPARVVLQDFTGVPCVVDLAAMRDAMI